MIIHERIQTRLATRDDSAAIFDMYNDMQQQQHYPAFRANAFYRAIPHIIERSSESEQLFVAVDETDTPVGMGHLVQPFSLTGNSRKAQELSHLYIDETQSDAFSSLPTRLAAFAAHLALQGCSRTLDESRSVSLHMQDTNCFGTLATLYPSSQESPHTIRFDNETLYHMASQAVTSPLHFTGLALVDSDTCLAHPQLHPAQQV